jgi:hypothetical protein
MTGPLDPRDSGSCLNKAQAAERARCGGHTESTQSRHNHNKVDRETEGNDSGSADNIQSKNDYTGSTAKMLQDWAILRKFGRKYIQTPTASISFMIALLKWIEKREMRSVLDCPVAVRVLSDIHVRQGHQCHQLRRRSGILRPDWARPTIRVQVRHKMNQVVRQLSWTIDVQHIGSVIGTDVQAGLQTLAYYTSNVPSGGAVKSI